jgi:OOP family OmpA-OmpF porin
MKHSIIAILAAACAIPAMADDGYFGASIGRAEQKLSAPGIEQSADSASGKVFAGYQFNRTLGAELGFVQFGKASFSGSGTVVSSHPSSLYAAITGTLPLNDDLAVYGQLGVARSHARLDISQDWGTGSVSANHTGAMAGVGVGYSLNANVLLFSEYEQFGKVLNEGAFCLRVQQLTFGARFKF